MERKFRQDVSRSYLCRSGRTTCCSCCWRYATPQWLVFQIPAPFSVFDLPRAPGSRDRLSTNPRPKRGRGRRDFSRPLAAAGADRTARIHRDDGQSHPSRAGTVIGTLGRCPSIPSQISMQVKQHSHPSIQVAVHSSKGPGLITTKNEYLSCKYLNAGLGQAFARGAEK